SALPHAALEAPAATSGTGRSARPERGHAGVSNAARRHALQTLRLRRARSDIARAIGHADRDAVRAARTIARLTDRVDAAPAAARLALSAPGGIEALHADPESDVADGSGARALYVGLTLHGAALADAEPARAAVGRGDALHALMRHRLANAPGPA